MCFFCFFLITHQSNLFSTSYTVTKNAPSHVYCNKKRPITLQDAFAVYHCSNTKAYEEMSLYLNYGVWLHKGGQKIDRTYFVQSSNINAITLTLKNKSLHSVFRLFYLSNKSPCHEKKSE